MSIFFISDLHLHESREQITKRFFRFLQEEAFNAQALYILGDFFEAYIGEDCLSPHDQNVLNQLSNYAKKVPTYFMQGNRDFLLKESLLKNLGITFLQDPSIIELDSKRILLMHGDSLCLKDINYQYFRRFVRHPFIQWLFLHLPRQLRQNIAGKLRKNSMHTEAKTKNKDLSIYDVTQDAVNAVLIENQSKILIHGHTHKPALHVFEYEGNDYKRIVLGDWGKKSIVLKYSNDDFQLEEIII